MSERTPILGLVTATPSPAAVSGTGHRGLSIHAFVDANGSDGWGPRDGDWYVLGCMLVVPNGREWGDWVATYQREFGGWLHMSEGKSGPLDASGVGVPIPNKKGRCRAIIQQAPWRLAVITILHKESYRQIFQQLEQVSSGARLNVDEIAALAWSTLPFVAVSEAKREMSALRLDRMAFDRPAGSETRQLRTKVAIAARALADGEVPPEFPGKGDPGVDLLDALLWGFGRWVHRRQRDGLPWVDPNADFPEKLLIFGLHAGRRIGLRSLTKVHEWMDTCSGATGPETQSPPLGSSDGQENVGGPMRPEEGQPPASDALSIASQTPTATDPPQESLHV